MRGICLVLALFGVPAIAAAQQPRPAQGLVPRQSGLPHRRDRLASRVRWGRSDCRCPRLGCRCRRSACRRNPDNDQRWNGNQQHGGNQRGGNQRDGQWKDGQGSHNPYSASAAPGRRYVYVTPPYPYYDPYPYYPYYGTQSTEVVVQSRPFPA